MQGEVGQPTETKIGTFPEENIKLVEFLNDLPINFLILYNLWILSN